MRLKSVLVGSLFFCLFFAGAEPSDYWGQQEITSILAKLEKSPSLIHRIETASEAFLSRPFLDGPLGEGQKGIFDNDPLCRTDGFDCTTYVETVMALALSERWEDFKQNLNEIRYATGSPSYWDRNHFPSLDWIPHNQSRLRDVTSQIGGALTQVAKTHIEKKAWFASHTKGRLKRDDLSDPEKEALLAQLQGPNLAPELTEVKTLYIPLEAVLQFPPQAFEQRVQKEKELKLQYQDQKEVLREKLSLYRREFLDLHKESIHQALLEKIPSGTLINYVCPDRALKKYIGSNMNITHQGWLIWKEDGLYARHASLGDRVKDIAFVDYLNQFAVPGALDFKGFNLQQILYP